MEEQGGNGAAPSSNESTSTKTTSSSPQCSTVSAYHVKINGVPHLVTVAWNKNLISQSFTISIDRPNAGGDKVTLTYKVELKLWPFWSKKGLKTVDIDSDRLDIFWDLRSAKFMGSNPEPAGGYYIALVSQEEVILLIGDCKKDAYKRTKSRPSLEDAMLVCRRESVFGKQSFTARTQFDPSKKEHEIIVESSLAGPQDPEMWITVDGYILVHIKNLQWKFRGNETMLVEQAPVQVFWDVHDWIFGRAGSQALFIFKPDRSREVLGEEDVNGGEHWNGIQSDVSEFCFFLHAWKME